MKNLLSSCRKTLSQMSKLFLRVQATFSCSFFVKIVQIFFVLFVFWLIQLHFRLNFIRQVLQNCTLRARGSFRGKTIGVRVFFNSSTISGSERKFFGFMAKTVRQPCQKCTFSASGKKTKEILFWKNVSISNIFLTSGWIVPDTQWHFSKVSSKSNFLFPKKNFGLNFVFKHKCLRLVLKPWANHIRTFDSKFLWTIFRTTSTCPKQRLHEEHFLWKKCLFHNLLNLSGTSPGLW